MKYAIILMAIAAGLVALGFTPAVQGALQALGQTLLQLQGHFQNEMAGALRGVHAGQAAAFWALMAICWLYGFVHAAGPGHGKALLGAYGAARRVPALKLAGIGLVSALAQGTTAVALVVGLAVVAGLGRSSLEGLDRGLLAVIGPAAMGLVGLWLIWRAVRRFALQAPAAPAGPASRMLAAQKAGGRPGAHVFCNDASCPDCGHAHLPAADDILRAASAREVAALVAAVAIRPCSGALILLLLTWQMGLLWVGILGTYAMALGTAGVAVLLALALALGRDTILRGNPVMGAAQGLRLGATIEALAGLALAIGALSVLMALR